MDPARAGPSDALCDTLHPVKLNKTSVYLSDEDRARLARLSEREGKSQATILREAIALYDARVPDLDFELFKMTIDPDAPGIPHFETGQELQDWIENEGMKGFGEDDWTRAKDADADR